jgi:HD-GYP domain-containing protein (c-di-GMP phosphodiesterase class II)
MPDGSHQYALEETSRNAGSECDPQVVQAFLGLRMSGFIRHEDTMREHAVPLSYAAM